MSLTTHQLAVQQAAIERWLMPDSCQLVTVSESRDALGTVVRTPVTGPAIACQLRAFSEQEAAHAASWVNGGTSLLKVPLATTVSSTMQVLYRGTTYEVAGLEPLTAYALARYLSLKLANPQ